MFTNFINKLHRLDQTEIRRSWLLVSIACHPHVRKRRERETKNSIVCRNSDRSIINGGTHQPIQRVVLRSTCTSFYGSNNLQLCHRVELFLCGTRLLSSTLYASEIHFFFLFLALSISLSAHSTAVPFVLFLSAGTEEPSWSKGKPFSVEISWFFLCEACSVSGSGEKLREKAEHPRKTLSEQRKLFQFLNYGWWIESAFST